MTRTPALLFLTLAGAVAATGPQTTRLAAEGDLPAAVLVTPTDGGKDRPLLVALHESGAAPEDVVDLLGAAAAKSGYALLAPAARGMAFAEEDLAGVAGRIEAVRARLGAGPVFLVGFTDSAIEAVRYAFARPRLFRAVVAIGADAPEVRERAPELRLLVMKAPEDRPIAGRISVERLADRVEAVDFCALPVTGELREPVLEYVRWFLDLAAGRVEAGEDPAIDWRNPARGAAERKAKGLSSLVYFFDADPAFRDRTLEIQGKLLFEPDLRHAIEAAVPILAPRAEAGKLFPDLHLQPGPAIVVTGKEGEVLLTAQKSFSAKTLAAALRH